MNICSPCETEGHCRQSRQCLFLKQCIASGQVSSAQVEAHHAAGEIGACAAAPRPTIDDKAKTTSEAAKTLAEQLRQACNRVRGKSYPLSDLIPLLQRTADFIDGARGVAPKSFAQLYTKHAAGIELARLEMLNEKAACLTCNGHRLIGGFEGGAAPGYVSEPCPDCNKEKK